MIWVGAHEWWPWQRIVRWKHYQFSGPNSVTYEFSTVDKVGTEKQDVKPTLGSLKLRDMNSLILGQIDINSIRNEKSNLWNKSW